MSQSGSAKATAAFRFGVFQFRAVTLELAKNGTAIRLQPQPARLLNLLLMNAGELVTRGTIRELLWKDGTNVDFEAGSWREHRRSPSKESMTTYAALPPPWMWTTCSKEAFAAAAGRFALPSGSSESSLTVSPANAEFHSQSTPQNGTGGSE